MRILQAHNQHALRGGADAVVDRERALLEVAGHDVEQYFTPSADAAGARSWQQGANAIWNRETVRGISAAVTAFEPDVLHVHTPFPLMSPAVFWAARRHQLPVVATLHSYRYSCVAATLTREGRVCEECVGRRLKVAAVRHRCYHGNLLATGAMVASLDVHRALGTFSDRVDRYLTLTEFGKQMLVREGISEVKIGVKPNFVPDPGEPLPAALRRNNVVFAGRLVVEKGVHTLLAAWPFLRGAGTRLHVIGDGPLADDVRRAAATDPTISFLGWGTEGRVLDELRRAQVAVVPSEWYEAGPPLVLLQALSAGTPALLSDVENIARQPVAAGAAECFATGNPQSLAVSLRRMLADRPRLARLSEGARRLYLDQHTPMASLRALEHTYRIVLRAGSSTRSPV
jgi:glycosyltransferase involved in cell wall biosynthesis